MNQKFNTVTKLFSVTADEESSSLVNKRDQGDLSDYKQRLYSEQLVELLGSLTDEHKSMGHNTTCLDDGFQCLIKPMTTQDINVQTLDEFTQQSCFIDDGVDDDVVDDYVTIVGELINGLYRMHDKCLSADTAQHNAVKKFAFNQF